MAGVKGQPGPTVPKRSDQRRRTNKPDREIDHVAGAEVVEVLESDPEWHPVAKRWFDSLAKSGQSIYYEPSDWASAWVLADSMSRELNPQPMVVGFGKDAHLEMVSLPPKAASIGAWIKGMASLLTTEGDRRRAALELERPGPGEGGEGDVTWLDDARRRMGSAG